MHPRPFRVPSVFKAVPACLSGSRSIGAAAGTCALLSPLPRADIALYASAAKNVWSPRKELHLHRSLRRGACYLLHHAEKLAGHEGFAPSRAVLETAMLLLHQWPKKLVEIRRCYTAGRYPRSCRLSPAAHVLRFIRGLPRCEPPLDTLVAGDRFELPTSRL